MDLARMNDIAALNDLRNRIGGNLRASDEWVLPQLTFANAAGQDVLTVCWIDLPDYVNDTPHYNVGYRSTWDRTRWHHVNMDHPTQATIDQAVDFVLDELRHQGVQWQVPASAAAVAA